MKTNQAVSQRLKDLCAESDIALNSLATLSGVTPSTVYSIVCFKSNNAGIVTIKKLCDGLDITVREFFDSPLFDEKEQELH